MHVVSYECFLDASQPLQVKLNKVNLIKRAKWLVEINTYLWFLYCLENFSLLLGPVVQKPIIANPGLNIILIHGFVYGFEL